jgi:hypothetical protein
LRSGKSAAVRLRDFFLGEIAFKTPAAGKASERIRSGT